MLDCLSTPSVLPKVISSFSYLSDVGEVRIAPEPDASLRAHAHAVTQISKASLIRNLRARLGLDHRLEWDESYFMRDPLAEPV